MAALVSIAQPDRTTLPLMCVFAGLPGVAACAAAVRRRHVLPTLRPDDGVFRLDPTDPVNSLVYLFDPVKQLEETGTDVADIVYEQLRGRTPARLKQYDAFVATHRRFYVAVLGESKGLQEWQFRYLLTKAHARLWWLGKVGDFDQFRAKLDSP